MIRRTDSELRNAINTVEKMLLTDSPKETIVLRCLKQLMSLLDASFGYAFECEGNDENENDLISWIFTGSFKQESGEIINYPNMCSSHHMPSDIQSRLSAGRCINSATGEIPTPLPNRHPKITNFYCIPLNDARRIYAVIYLCN